MKYFLNQNVFDAALERIEWLFNEFEIPIVNFSGGKDSTVVLNLCLMVAEKLGRLPLKVLFVDQEAEWQTVIDYIREVMADPRIEPIWLQCPIRISNGTSTTENWLYCWEDGKEDEWIRQREEISIKENIFGTKTFAELFRAVPIKLFGEYKTASIGGVRCEEIPARQNGLTAFACYKHVTWGNREDKRALTFYPIYDWSYTDVWKAIHDNNWPYCKLYDYYWQHGVPVVNMRVSNVHHETAINHLYYFQEIEKETWDKITARIGGISTAGHLKSDGYQVPKELPYMFSDWKEYRNYLLEKLIVVPDQNRIFQKCFARMDEFYKDLPDLVPMYKIQISGLLTNDYHLTKIRNWESGNSELRSWVRVK